MKKNSINLSKKFPTNLFDDCLKAKTVAEVELILKKLTTSGLISWANIGGKNITNTSIINIAKEPGSGIIELVTNAIDANIQFEFVKNREPKGLKSPRQASEKFFGITGGRLNNIKNTRDIEHVSKLTEVTLYDSGVETKPTLEVRDYGIGISAKDFDSTILSLHKGNKNSKPHQGGLFGQGGSTALKFCPYRIIISKPAFTDKNNSNIVAITIVRYSPTKADGTLSTYEYCINKETGKPIEILLKKGEEFAHGTLIRQIEMEIGGFYKKITVPDDQSMWYLLHHNLFDSILPITLIDKRELSVKYENERFSKKNNTDRVKRYITGNNRLLSNRFKFPKINSVDDNSEEELPGVEYFQERDVKCNFGIVKVFYWIINPKDKNGKLTKKIKQYASESSRIVFCHNGQKHHSLSRSFITKSVKENGVGFPYLDNSLIVQVDLDLIDFPVKEKLMTSTRESLSNIPELRELENNLAFVLSNDEKLSEFNLKRQREFRSGANETVISEEVSKKITKMLNGKLPKFLGDLEGVTLGDGNVLLINGNDKNSGHRKEKEYPEIITTDNPTYFNFDSETKNIYSGKKFSILFSTDASEKLITFDNLCFEIYNKTRDICDIKPFSVMNILDHKGYGKLLFTCDNTMQVGDVVSLGVYLKNNPNVGDIIELQVKEPKEKASDDSDTKKKSQTKYVVRKLKEDDNNFGGIFPDKKIVSDYKEEENQVVIYLNMSHPLIEEYMFPSLESKQKNKLILETISDEYSTDIAVLTVLHYHNEYKSKNDENSSNLENLDFEDKKIIFNQIMITSARALISKITSKEYMREKHYLKDIE